MEKFLIVDGSNLLFQMFYGMPSRIINHQGKAIQGTLGFIGALLKIIRSVMPTHIAVVFDGETCNPRRELDGDYKANRPDYSQMAEEETPFSQLPDIYAALDWLEIAHKETQNCEADDWIAGFARAYGRDAQVVIVSQDSDFFQLITDRVQILRYRGDRTVICDCAYIREKLGITPEQYAAFKALTGDTADNIRGVEKVGAKTAAQLLEQFENLDNLIARADEIKKPSICAAVSGCVERLRLNYQLIRLDGDVSLPFEEEQMRYIPKNVTTTQVLRAIGLRQ